MTDSLSKNIPQSTKSWIAPIEYFTDIHPKPYTQSKFKQKKVMQNSPGGAEQANLIAENYKERSSKMKSDLLKKVAANKVILKYLISTATPFFGFD